MISRLRIKFTVVAMFSMLLVLVIIIGGINILNYQDVVRRADDVLEILASNKGSLPDFAVVEFTDNNHDFQDNVPPRMDAEMDPDMDPGNLEFEFEFNHSPELFFEVRFFSVVFKNDGQVTSSDTGKIYAVDTSTAIKYAQKVLDEGNSRGFIDNYRYLLSSYDDDSQRVIFYDCGRALDDFRAFRNQSIIVSAVGFVFVGILIFFLSGFVFKPVLESYERQKRFITDAGHEIKTPLAIINADSDVLSLDIGEENEWLSDIKTQTKRLSELTDDLIMLSKMEEGKQSLMMTNVNLSDLAEKVSSSFLSAAVADNKTIINVIAPNVTLKCDEKAISQLFSILLSNAIKYSPDSKSIFFELSKTGSNVQLSVRNSTSSSISEEDLKHIFERFYRTDKSRSSETGGHGIGLSIAKAIVDAHGGKISASVDKNNEFVITVVL